MSLRLSALATGVLLLVVVGAGSWYYLHRQTVGRLWESSPLNSMPGPEQALAQTAPPSDGRTKPSLLPPVPIVSVPVNVINGRSTMGNPIPTYLLGPADKPVGTMVIGVIHGDEPQGEYMGLKLLADLLQQPDTAFASGRVIVVPVMNPDGKAKHTRGNAHGVDLNRNLPSGNWKPAKKDRYWGGPQPDSELETHLLLSLIREYHPRHILAIHAPYHLINFDGPAKILAHALSAKNGYRVAEDIGYPTYGSLGHYCADHDIGIITLEVPSVSPEEAWQQNKEALKTFCLSANTLSLNHESTPDSPMGPIGKSTTHPHSSDAHIHSTPAIR